MSIAPLLDGPPVKVGVFGGTGLYSMDGLTGLREVAVATPFGDPSAVVTVGELDGVRVAFIPRHGRGHSILPSEIPARANVYAMKLLGVERLISISAVGSLREYIEPLHMVVPDQIIDRTQARPSTFFGEGLAVHIAFGEPFCPELSGMLAEAAAGTGATVHRDGTYLVMEGPAFSTRAESQMYRGWGADVIGMTALPEAKLAREAEMCFAVLATATDYDAWHADARRRDGRRRPRQPEAERGPLGNGAAPSHPQARRHGRLRMPVGALKRYRNEAGAGAEGDVGTPGAACRPSTCRKTKHWERRRRGAKQPHEWRSKTMEHGRQDPGEPYRRISVQEAYEMQQEGALVVDVRRPDEWVTGHARGAVHIPVDDMLNEAETNLPKDQDLLFICAAGVRSGLAAEMASALGFEAARLYNVEQGTPTWIQADLPTDVGE